MTTNWDQRVDWRTRYFRQANIAQKLSHGRKSRLIKSLKTANELCIFPCKVLNLLTWRSEALKDDSLALPLSSHESWFTHSVVRIFSRRQLAPLQWMASIRARGVNRFMNAFIIINPNISSYKSKCCHGMAHLAHTKKSFDCALAEVQMPSHD